MPKNPTLSQRVAWHKAHSKFCACRQAPPSIKEALEQDQSKEEIKDENS